VLVVVNDKEPEVLTQAQRIARVSITPYSERAQPIDSLRTGLREMPVEVSAVVILPVDCALVTSATVRTLIESYRNGTHAAVVPRWRNASGHPVVLGRMLFDELTRETLPEGLRTLLRDRAQDVAFVSIEDEGITIDIDTLEDARQRGVDV
jgi:CTP:molybdopterin cytidylyltransferase MocA